MLGKRRADGPPGASQERPEKRMYPLLEYHIDQFLQSLEGEEAQSEKLQGAIFLLKEAIRLTSFGGHPRTMRHHLFRVKSLVSGEDEIGEDLMIVFDCLDHLDEMYP